MDKRRYIELNPDVDQVSYDKPTRQTGKNRSRKNKDRDRERNGPKEHYTRQRFDRRNAERMFDDELDF